MATQKEVAQRAGVSFITVSRVINNLGNVKAETQERVEQAIRELNYHPNRQAQALNSGFTHTIGLVTPRLFGRPLFDNFYVMTLLSGVEIKARELGWDVLMSTDFDLDREFDFLRVWHQRKVDGLIFVGLQQFPEAQVREIEEREIPCVSIADRINSEHISWVDTDNATAATDAVHRLATLGHRKLAFLGVDPTAEYNPNFRDRQNAVERAARDLQLDLTVLTPSGVGSAGRDSAQFLVEQNLDVTGIVAGNDSIAFDFIPVMARAGRLCPRDYSLIAFDAEPAGQRTTPTLASYQQPLLEMGQAAVSLLVDRMTDRLAKRRGLEFPLTYVSGTSADKLL